MVTMLGIHFTGWEGEPWTDGPTHVRLWDNGVSWRAIHTAVDTYEWARLDAMVDFYTSKGVKITYVACATPQWLAMDPHAPHFAPWLGEGSNSLPYDVDEWNKFIWNLATRYRGRIHYYEIWNEPQLADFMYPYDTATCNRLATMTQRAKNTIDSIDPAAMVIAASVLPRQSSGGMNKAQRFLDALEAKGWPCDAYACHIYPEVGYWAPRWKEYLADVKDALAAMNAPNKSKIWVTETTYGLLGDPIPEDKAAAVVDQTYQHAAALGVQQVYWYAWNRPDLGGLQIKDGSTAWSAIRRNGNG
jgi:hypothetical protein